jgi:hypothetical protein
VGGGVVVGRGMGAANVGVSDKAFDPKASPDQRQQAIAKLVKSLSADKSPIFLGPFRSELGFEMSYWQPFLAWLAKQVKGFPERAIVVTRGGLAPLYQPIASRGIDLYTLRTVTEVRRENLYDQKMTGLLKQIAPTDWDARVLEDAARRLHLGPVFHTVHPAWMYWGLAPYWEESVGMRYLQAFTDYTPLGKAEKPTGDSLPEKYVAMKFYARATFPYPDADVESFVSRTAATIASQIPVVLLSSADEYDDHADIRVEGPNIFNLGPMPAHENLMMQMAVLSNAKAFIGTYGGVAQTAVRLGIPSVSLWKEFGGTAHAHLSLQSWISKATKVPFTSGSLTDASLWQGVLALPPMVMEAPIAEVVA